MLGNQFAQILQRSREVLPSAELGGDFLELFEYAALKQEQSNRIALRETALYVNLAASISLLAARLQTVIAVDDSVVLLMPFLSGIMFWIYFNNDSYVREIGQYILKYLAPRISEQLSTRIVRATTTDAAGNEITSQDVPDIERTQFIFAWEHWHRRKRAERWIRKIAAILVLALSFVAVPLLALWVPIGSHSLAGHIFWEWLSGLLVTVIMAIGVIRLYI